MLIFRDEYAWLDGFTAPVGDPWRAFVSALTAEALRRAAELKVPIVRTDVYEFGAATREPLRDLGFGPEPGSPHGDRNRFWTVDLG